MGSQLIHIWIIITVFDYSKYPRDPNIVVIVYFGGPICPGYKTGGPICPKYKTGGPICPRYKTDGPICPRYKTGGPICPRYKTGGPICPRYKTGGPICPRYKTGGPICPRYKTGGPICPRYKTGGPICPRYKTGGPICPKYKTGGPICPRYKTGGPICPKYKTGGADSLQQRSLQTILKFGIVKEEQQENCDEGKPEDIFVTVKTEQPHDLPKDEVISKFSVNSDDDLDNSEYGVISVKTELQQCTESRLESTSGGADSLQQRSLQTILKFGIVKEEQQENCDEGKTEDIFVTVKTEQPHDLPKDEVISKFSVNSDDDLDNSEYGVISVKTELQQCTESRLESTSGGADSLQQRCLQTILKFGIVKEERQENCDEGKTEDIFVTVKTEQPHDLPKDEVISKFSVNSDDDLDNSEYGVISVKTELQQCTESRLESTSDIKTCVNSCCGSSYPDYHLLKQEDLFKDVKSSRLNIDVCGKTNLNGSNIKQPNIHEDDEKTYSYVTCGKGSVTSDNVKQHRRILRGKKLYTCEISSRHIRFGRSLRNNKEIHNGEKPYSCATCGKQFGCNGNLKKA
ncbi:uncharacterized protein LOC143227570 [Tachypleus tridentatus]|uniref:uncharacterized protein LOC143227570 n=1 Tax=Tachypleus tridentatus TaxID=6853 RepID=UPI003FD0B789